jgi:hypothetical protein
MKRIDQDVAGRPKFAHARRDVAGVEGGQWASVASFRNALRQSLNDPTAALAEDAMLLEDMADFMFAQEGDALYTQQGPALPEADPDFRERLRGRLWRTFVQTHLRDRGERH